MTDLQQSLVAALPVIQDGLVKGVFSAAGKELYERAKSLLPLRDQDIKDEAKVREAFAANPDAHAELTRLMVSYQSANQATQINNVQTQGAGVNHGEIIINIGR